MVFKNIYLQLRHFKIIEIKFSKNDCKNQFNKKNVSSLMNRNKKIKSPLYF